jgi:uncharacterized protein YceH (UPF0502 family)
VSSSLLPGLAALIGTLAGVAATYLVASRKSSGRIRTSEAEVLWEASESIRHDLTAEVAVLRAEVAALKAELAQLRARLEA